MSFKRKQLRGAKHRADMSEDVRKYVMTAEKAYQQSKAPKISPEGVLEGVIEIAMSLVKFENDNLTVRARIAEWFYSTPGVAQICVMIDANIAIGAHQTAIGYHSALHQMCIAALVPGFYGAELKRVDITAGGGQA